MSNNGRKLSVAEGDRERLSVESAAARESLATGDIADPHRTQAFRITRAGSVSSTESRRPGRRRTFSFSRKRGFSRSSQRTVESISSVKSQRSQRSRRRSVDQDSDSEKSMGETDEDVCFPMEDYDEPEQDGVKIDELDQLLDLSDSREVGSQSPAEILGRDWSSEPRPEPEGPHGEEAKIKSGQTGTSDETYVTTPPMIELQDPIKSPAELRVPFIASRHTNLNDLPALELPKPESGHDGASALRAGAPDPPDDTSIVDAKRFSFFTSNMASTIHASDLTSLVGEGESFASLFNKKNGFWWLDCCAPTDLEIKILSRAFGIHPLTAEDIRTKETREKFELFKKYYFVCFLTFDDDPKAETFLDPVNFYMVVFPDGVLSFHYEPVSAPKNVRRRMRQLRDYVTVTPDWICYALIDDITDSFAPVIHQIEEEVDNVEDSLYKQNNSSEMPLILEKITHTRRQTMSMLRLLSGKSDVIRGFAKRCNESHSNMPGSDIALYLGDIQDHIVTMYQNLTAYEKILGRSHVNYMAQLQVEFVRSSNRLTNILSKATLLGSIILPMSLVPSLFGMNVEVPGKNADNLGWFFGILGVMLLCIGIICYIGNRWIGRYASTG